jgi:hypothetical protein
VWLSDNIIVNPKNDLVKSINNSNFNTEFVSAVLTPTHVRLFSSSNVCVLVSGRQWRLLLNYSLYNTVVV